jgi:thiol-disulfide isomerase/thioredoxin
MLRTGLFFLTALMSLSVWATTTLIPFKENSYSRLIENNNSPFLMVLWSLDCPPCLKELNMLGSILKENPDMKLVLVSTDSPSRIENIKQRLNTAGLSGAENQIFTSASSQRLRYSIDPAWYGELPRSYFHVNNKRHAISGMLDKREIINWLNINNDQ